MKRSTLLESLALGASCAFLITVGRFPVQANAQAAAESAGEILPLVQFENAPLVDVIKTLARLPPDVGVCEKHPTGVDVTTVFHDDTRRTRRILARWTPKTGH